MKLRKSDVGGISANRLVIPLAVVIAILHIAIIYLVYEVNRSNLELSDMMQKCSENQQTATNLQAGNSILSETATAFAQIPVQQDGSMNVGPLMRYAQELDRGRQGQQVREWFRNQNVNPEALSYIEAAAEAAQKMYDIQLHVIALLCSVYSRPPVPALSVIPDVPLTEEEQAMPPEQRVGYARSLILDQSYSMLKADVADNIENCHRVFQEDYARASGVCESHINDMRNLLWIVILAIIIILLATFILFYRWFVMPLRSYARQITSDQSMNQASIIQEMRLVENAYNGLLKRHDKLESILRSAAETDALTDLPNRYSLEQYMLEAADDRSSMAVLLFDVNYLKRMNDTNGHGAGDILLRTAGACIRECFEDGNNGRIYRIGGDEFAAVLRGCSEDEVKSRIDRFSLAQERENISVSVGYAFAGKVDDNSFQKLFKKADQEMYANKKLFHENDHTACDR